MSCALGGETTLRSYGLFDINGHSAKRIQARLLELIPGSHITFLEKLESMVEYDELAFVHAGIVPGVSLSRQLEDDLVWIRDEFLLDTGDHGKLIVHGHSAIHSPTHYGNRVNLDTGAGYFRRLTVAVFEDRDCWALTDLGREKLEPSPHMVGKVRNPI